MARVLDAALAGGIRVFDTAGNYRRGRSERVLGSTMRQAVADGVVAREDVVLATKGGYVRPGGGVPTAGPPPERHDPLDHCLRADCLRHQVATSRQTLDMGPIDVYYLHNPEEQMARAEPEELGDLMRQAFAVLEESVADSAIRTYGIATWRLGPAAARTPLHPARLHDFATDIAGPEHHFAAVQAPLSMLRQDALAPVYEFGGTVLSLPTLCARLGLVLTASASAGGGRAPTLAAASARWTAAVPNVTTALIGTTNVDHLHEALVPS